MTDQLEKNVGQRKDRHTVQYWNACLTSLSHLLNSGYVVVFIIDVLFSDIVITVF